MAAEEEQPNNNRHSFFSFPEDVQLSILSFLNPPDISSFSLTSKPSLSLSLSSSLWFSLCHRQFSPFTNISLWLSRTTRHVTYRRLYNTLSHLHPLVGFWRRSGSSSSLHQPPLVVFEWAPSFVIGYRISPSLGSGLYRVLKSPFVWIGIGPHGDLVSFLDPDARFNFPDSGEFEALENDLVSVSVNFIGDRHVVIEENWNWGNGRVVTEEGTVMVMEEIYCYFANRTSPGTKRKQRRRDKERRKLEPEHFVKIVNCEPTPQRPLQGLWKGIGDDMKLDFYLVAYDDIGGIVCRRVGDWSQPPTFAGNSPVFWTSNTNFIEPPFSPAEQYIYDSRTHLWPVTASEPRPCTDENRVVSRFLDINSSYDLVIPDLAEVSTNPRQVEGRIWQYGDGTFGFGFLRNNYIIDLKPIAQDDFVLDANGAV